MIREVEFTGADLPKIAHDVLCHEVVILKNSVSPALIRTAVQQANEWANVTPQSKDHPHTAGAVHLTSYLPARSDSRYIAHDWLLHRSMPSPMAGVMPVFEELRKIYNGLLEADFQFSETYEGLEFLPQIIQYPRGGGFFQEHFHPLRPQKIGLVLAGSQYGVDYKVGGGRFRDPAGKWKTTEGAHDIGDVTLFRFDIGHDITPVDPDLGGVDWARADGRWSFVLPLKRCP